MTGCKEHHGQGDTGLEIKAPSKVGDISTLCTVVLGTPVVYNEGTQDEDTPEITRLKDEHKS